MIVIVAGVAGSGKTTIGIALARRLGVVFADADAFHPPENVAKMAAGQPLTDEDRGPWLAALGEWIDERIALGESGVLTCSGLRRAYRDELRRDGTVRWVYLKISLAEATRRAATRHGHFFRPELVASQFAEVEEPETDEETLIVDAERPVESIVDDIIGRLA